MPPQQIKEVPGTAHQIAKENQITEGQHKNTVNKNKGIMAAPVNTGYTNAADMKESDLKSMFMKMLEEFKEETKKSFKYIQ